MGEISTLLFALPNMGVSENGDTQQQWVFLRKKDPFGVFSGYHHLRKHPYAIQFFHPMGCGSFFFQVAPVGNGSSFNAGCNARKMQDNSPDVGKLKCQTNKRGDNRGQYITPFLKESNNTNQWRIKGDFQ